MLGARCTHCLCDSVFTAIRLSPLVADRLLPLECYSHHCHRCWLCTGSNCQCPLSLLLLLLPYSALVGNCIMNLYIIKPNCTSSN